MDAAWHPMHSAQHQALWTWLSWLVLVASLHMSVVLPLSWPPPSLAQLGALFLALWYTDPSFLLVVALGAQWASCCQPIYWIVLSNGVWDTVSGSRTYLAGHTLCFGQRFFRCLGLFSWTLLWKRSLAIILLNIWWVNFDLKLNSWNKRHNQSSSSVGLTVNIPQEAGLVFPLAFLQVSSLIATSDCFLAPLAGSSSLLSTLT